MTAKAGSMDASSDTPQEKDQLRFVICGAEGGGKSTLLGRLLDETRTALEDGPRADGEPGIAANVTWRHFEAERRKFMAADVPDPEQRTRSVVLGATSADLAVILVDAREGILTQTRRYSYIVSLMGVRQTVLAVNKMDLADYARPAFEAVAEEYAAFAHELGIEKVQAIPLSASTGENVRAGGTAMPWYAGPALLEALEGAAPRREPAGGPFRLPVQRVDRSDLDSRGPSGTIASGRIECGMAVSVFPSGVGTTVARIRGPSGDLRSAVAGQAVTLILTDEIDIGPGDVIAAPIRPPAAADQFAAHLLWLNGSAMLPERTYAIRIGTASATAQVTDLVHRVDVDTLRHLAAKTLERDEVGYCKLALDRRVAFDPYSENRRTGAFVLVDKFTGATAGVGVIHFPLRRATNVVWQPTKIDRAARAHAKGQVPRLLWITGLPAAGKSTVADRLEQKLHAAGVHTYLLDGDNVRHGLNRDLGFTEQDRVENVRRVAEVAKLMVDAGLVVIVSMISPFRSERRMARDLVNEGEFVEVFVDTPLAVCESRDPKGLYRRARAGELINFTGIDSPYEPPEAAEIVLKGAEEHPDTLAGRVVDYLNVSRNSAPDAS